MVVSQARRTHAFNLRQEKELADANAPLQAIHMTTLAAVGLMMAMTSAEAIITLLNSPSASSVAKYAEAQSIVRREAAANRPLQQFVLGVTTDDRALAERMLAASRKQIEVMASERDNPLAWYLLAVDRNDMKLLRRAANLGNVQALNALGTIETQKAMSGDYTNDVKIVFAKGFACFREAAEKRDPNGLVNLGACYMKGIGCEHDYGMAFQCYRQAAELGHPEAMDNISASYQFGHGVEKNVELSLEWGMRGRAARGDKAAAKWLKERK